MQVYNVKVAFFDLDDSLINKDASSLWIKWRIRHERWALVEGILALGSLYRSYKKGRISHRRLSRYYRTRTRGLSPDGYQERVERFFRERGYLHIYPQAASLLFAYRRQGVTLVLITGADDYVARAYGKALGIEHVISNRLSVLDGRITGLERPLCYGVGKVGLARTFLREQGLGFADAAFYSDSHADLPLLEKVGQPVVLNPNDQLQKLAQERGWPCLDWRSLTPL